MAAYVQMGDIKGESTEQNHKDWIIIQSATQATNRSIPAGAKDQQRTKGETTLADLVLVRNVDKSSPKLFEASATGLFFKMVQIDFTTTVKGKQQVYMTYKLGNVIVTGYNQHAAASGDPLPSEEVTLGGSDLTVTYTVVDPNTGDPKGQVVGAYNPSVGKGS